ncbi:unnamed protein product, partial [Mesorhabditis spiculigera]
MGNKKSKDQEDKALSPYSSWGHSLDDLLCGDGKICDDRWTPISLSAWNGENESGSGGCGSGSGWGTRWKYWSAQLQRLCDVTEQYRSGNAVVRLIEMRRRREQEKKYRQLSVHHLLEPQIHQAPARQAVA